MESYNWPGLKINKELKMKGTWEQVFSLESKTVAAFENKQTGRRMRRGQRSEANTREVTGNTGTSWERSRKFRENWEKEKTSSFASWALNAAPRRTKWRNIKWKPSGLHTRRSDTEQQHSGGQIDGPPAFLFRLSCSSWHDTTRRVAQLVERWRPQEWSQWNAQCALTMPSHVNS